MVTVRRVERYACGHLFNAFSPLFRREHELEFSENVKENIASTG